MNTPLTIAVITALGILGAFFTPSLAGAYTINHWIYQKWEDANINVGMGHEIKVESNEATKELTGSLDYAWFVIRCEEPLDVDDKSVGMNLWFDYEGSYLTDRRRAHVEYSIDGSEMQELDTEGDPRSIVTGLWMETVSLSSNHFSVPRN